MTRNGKIARLPKAVREELNRRLADGEPGKRLVAWLNSIPEVRTVLAAEFAGRPITENNLSEWKSGGFREWERQQELLATARTLAEQADELRESAGRLTDHLAMVLTVRLAEALRAGESLGEGEQAKELRCLRALCAEVVELRRGDHSAARLRLEQERREAEREKSDEEILGLFERWATMPRLRALLTDPRLSGAEKRRRLRDMLEQGEEPGAGSEQPEAGREEAVKSEGTSPGHRPGPLPGQGEEEGADGGKPEARDEDPGGAEGASPAHRPGPGLERDGEEPPSDGERGAKGQARPKAPVRERGVTRESWGGPDRPGRRSD